jgi:hypothetical protein
MKGLEPHIGEILNDLNTPYEKSFERHKYCMDCVYLELCRGPEDEYLEQFGEKEFSPVVADRHVRDIKALHE